MVPEWVTTLPAVNAALNALSTVLLVCGYWQIRRGQRRVHKRLMLSCFGVSIVFLACYLVYHFALAHYTDSASKAFPGTGAIRIAYLTMLLTHVILAATVPFLALVTIYHALRAERSEEPDSAVRWARHRRMAKITFPIWVYVSVTGVIIYIMVYPMAAFWTP